MTCRSLVLPIGLLLGLPLAGAAQAGVFDEFVVHGTDIAPPGEREFDLYQNYGLRGIARPAFQGGLATDRAFYTTPQLGLGVTRWWETAVLLPTAIDRTGAWHAGGVKFHNVVVLPQATPAPWSFGAVLEVSRLTARFQPFRTGWEVRPLAQYRAGPWTAKLTLGLTGGIGHGGEAVFAPSAGVYRAFGPRLILGLEQYSQLGQVRRLEPGPRQGHQLFLRAGTELGPVQVGLGVGRGLTAATEPWVVTLHLGVEF